MADKFPSQGQFRLHRSWFSVLPHIALAFAVASIVFWFSSGTKFFGLSLPAPSGSDGYITLPVYLLVFGVLLVRPLILMKDCKHTVGEHHLYSITGLCSLRKENIEIPFEDVLGVRSIQSIIDRMLGVGTVIAWTATSERPEIVMKGLKDPDQIVHAIRKRIDLILQEKPFRQRIEP